MSAGVALVTGAARRVGRAIALTLAQRGCDIALHHHTARGDARQTADDIRALGRRVELLVGDLADPQVPAALPGRAARALGSLTYLVNNAAIFEPTPHPAPAVEPWQKILQVNLVAPALLARAAAAHLPDGGAIVNLCDISAERPWAGYDAYCASKAGLVNLTKSLARALAPRVRVNGVSPGIAAWPDHFSDEQRKALAARVPLLRAGTPEEVAAAVAFLLLDAAYITGEVLAVDGGRNISW
ncbi:MAG: SDR family oxidoreductase [Phycisphaerae bacterium]